jgi:hypothetical protein
LGPGIFRENVVWGYLGSPPGLKGALRGMPHCSGEGKRKQRQAEKEFGFAPEEL